MAGPKNSAVYFDSSAQPATVGRVLDGGASQVSTFTYNSKNQITSRTDPAGRQTTFTYATNGLDLLQVEQVRSGGTDVLATFADYTSRRLPQTITDAAGQTTTITYNAFGQPLTVTNAKNETTTFAYETDTQNLLTVTGPVSGATTTFTYDAYNRVDSVEGPDGYLVTFAYDNLNRVLVEEAFGIPTNTYDFAPIVAAANVGGITREIDNMLVARTIGFTR